MSTTNPNVPGQPAAPMTAVPVDSTKPAAPAAAPAPAPKQDLKAEKQEDKPTPEKAHADEQAEFQKANKEGEGKPYFEQQEAFGKAFEEKEGTASGRRQRRLEREAEEVASEGDPTRDAVAKQAAMDRTVVQPGAVENAKAIKEAGKQHYEDQSEAFRGVK